MEKKFRLMPTMMPNFIPVQLGLLSEKQDGFKPTHISLAELSEDEAKEYVELLKRTFIEHWRNKTTKTNQHGSKGVASRKLGAI